MCASTVIEQHFLVTRQSSSEHSKKMVTIFILRKGRKNELFSNFKGNTVSLTYNTVFRREDNTVSRREDNIVSRREDNIVSCREDKVVFRRGTTPSSVVTQ